MYKYFTEDELKCKHTGLCDMDWAFMQTVERIRERCGFPFKVSSAYRSPEHPIEAKKSTPELILLVRLWTYLSTENKP